MQQESLSPVHERTIGCFLQWYNLDDLKYIQKTTKLELLGLSE